MPYTKLNSAYDIDDEPFLIIPTVTIREYPELPKAIKMQRGFSVGAMIYLSLIMSNDTYVIRNTPTAKIKRKRAEKKLPPIFEYSAVHIRDAVKFAHDARSVGGAKARHFRRGHLRSLANGAITPVSPCIVNAGAINQKHKKYIVENLPC